MAESLLDRFASRQSWLDPLAKSIQKLVGGTYRALGPLGPPLRNVAHGTWVLKHPLHPALTDVPLGAWAVGVIADYVAVTTHVLPTQAGDIALLVGLVAALGAVLTGYTDFHDTYGMERRAALLHGGTMTVVFLVELVSLVLRWLAGPDLHGVAVALATIGLLLAMLGMYLGGHVVYGFGTMVNRNAFAEPPSKPVDGGASADFAEGAMKRVEAGSVPVVVTRLGGKLYAMSATCSHAGGPLDEGKLDGDIVTCPWHGSRFCVRDGSVLGGPATFSQPAWKVEERDGRVTLTAGASGH